jgi:hypothetical protein
MSLETEIAALTSKATSLIDYFNARKNSIDSAVAAAIAAVPETTRSWYVDQAVGLDTNPGTREAPFKTIEKALKSTPAAGTCQVNLLSDYTMESRIISSCAYLYIYGGFAATQPKLKPKYSQSTEADGVITSLSSFLMLSQSSSIEIRNVDVVFPSTAGVSPAPTNTRLCSLIRANSGSSLPPIIGVSLESLAVTMDASFFGALVGPSTCATALNVYSTTFPSGFGGKYIAGVSSGTDPKSLNNVLTNLNAL